MELKESKFDDLLIIMNGMSFGQRQASEIVGGRGRLFRLVSEGKIRSDKPTNKQNGKWFCNASDVIRYAQLSYRKGRSDKKERASA